MSAQLLRSDFASDGFQVIPKKAMVPGGKLRIEPDEQTYCTQAFADKYPKSIVDSNYLITTLRDLVSTGPSSLSERT